MAVFVTHAMEEGWKQQWFYSIMAHRVSACILTGSMLQGLSVHRAKCNEKGVIRAIMICIRLRAFVILRLQFHCTEKVVQLRSSTASRYRAYLVNSMRFSI